MRLPLGLIFEVTLRISGAMFAGFMLHELTHIMLMGNAQGLCIGTCNNHLAGVYINVPDNATALQTGEELPNVAMFEFWYLFAAYMHYCIYKNRRDNDDEPRFRGTVNLA
jgi:hypothetical protein